MRAASAALLLIASACASAPTELLLEVDTTLSTTEADGLRIDVTRPGGETQTARSTLVTGTEVRRLSLWHTGGPLGPVHLRASATLGGTDVLVTERSVTLVQGERLTLRITLGRACLGLPPCGAGLTCDAGTCRSIDVAACELSSAGCGDVDAGRPDAAPLDSSVRIDGEVADGGPPMGDGGDACPLLTGICGAPPHRLPGDRLRATPCTATSEVVSWNIMTPSGAVLASPEADLRDPGEYVGTAQVARIAGCTADLRFTVAAPVTASTASRPSFEIRAMSARLGAAYFATADGAWEARAEVGWRALATGASGPLPIRDLGATAVVGESPVFAARGDEPSFWAATIPPDFSSTTFATTPTPAGDRGTYSMAAGGSSASSSGSQPAAIATKDGVVVLRGSPGAFTATQVGANADVDRDIAVSIDAMERPGRGALWALADGELMNRSFGPATPFLAGAPTPVMGRPVAVAADDRMPGRLAICGSTGLRLYDLSSDWSVLTALPLPVATLTLDCRDVAFDDVGDVWMATSAGLLRVDRDGVERWRSGAADPIGARSMDRVAVVWRGAQREVWVFSTARALHVISAVAP